MEDPPRPSDFKAFFNSAEYSDLTIISSDGREYKAHRVVLANLSPELNELVSQAEHGFVQFEEPGNVVEMLLQWCYGVEWPAATHRNVVVADFEILADVMDATSRVKDRPSLDSAHFHSLPPSPLSPLSVYDLSN